MKRLFVHECQRVFFDRCVTMEDQNVMLKYLNEALGGGSGFPATEIETFFAEPLVYQPFTAELAGDDFAMLPIE